MAMTISQILKKMITYSAGNLHDINHLMKVHSFARMIGNLEKLDAETQYVLEIAAIVHDIACPLCRKKYGNTNGKYQEIEGVILAGEFLKDTGVTDEQVVRIQYLVGHHHTFNEIDGLDYQILIESDYLVNADESGYSFNNIQNFGKRYFKTKSGIQLLNSIYGSN